MTVTLDTFRLWNGQESQRMIQGNVRVDSIIGMDSDETLLTGFEGQENVTYTGTATGNRISQQAGFSSDPLTALAEWCAELETFVNGTQGTGYTFEDTTQNRSINAVASSVGWQRTRAAKFEVSWDIELIRGQAMMEDISTSPESVSPDSTAELDGWDLGDIHSYRCDKEQPFDVYYQFDADPGGNPITSEGGAVRRWTLTGSITGATYQNDFDDHMRTLVGSDSIVTYDSAFPGRQTPVMVRSFESTREAGVTRLGEYNIEFIEGVA